MRQSVGPSGRIGAETTTVIRFSAFGRRFDVELVPNERLIARLRANKKFGAELTTYRGALADTPGSWARFSLLDGRFVGVIWDGSELLFVDSAAAVRNLIPGNPADDATLVFRASDVQLRIDDALHAADAGKTVRGDQLYAEIAQLMKNTALPTRGIPLGLILDAEYPDLGNEGHALFPTNIADGIHSAQVNLHLDVEYIKRFDYVNDPFVSNNPTVLLNQLPDIKTSTPELATLGLAHFLTYRELDGDVRGIAHFNSLCGNANGTGLTEVRGSTLDGLIMAHEIAHNFGAPHDGEAGSACQSTATTYLMSATINGSQQFSPCSLSQMAPILNNASCLTTVAPGDVSLIVEPVPSVILYQQPFALQFFVNNLGNETSFDGFLESIGDTGLEFTNFTVGSRDCGHQPDNQRRSCALDTLYGGESDRVNVTVRPVATGPTNLQTTVSSSYDLDPTNNDVLLNFDVQVATDMFTQGVVQSPNLRPGETTAITAHVFNRGDFDTDAILTIRTTQVNSVSTNENCVVVSSRWLECQLGNVPTQTNVDRVFEFTVNDSPLLPNGMSREDVDLIVTATLPDSVPLNNSFSAHVRTWGAFIDLRPGFISAPATLLVGEIGEVVLSLSNDGPDTAPDGRMELRLMTLAQPESIVVSRGRCDLVSTGALCDWTDILAGEQIEIRFKFKPVGGGAHSLSALTRHTDAFDTDNNNDNSSVEITSLQPPAPPPNPGNQSSGGGAMLYVIPLLVLQLFGRTLRRRPNPRV
jgi:hypothetical protein